MKNDIDERRRQNERLPAISASIRFPWILVQILFLIFSFAISRKYNYRRETANACRQLLTGGYRYSSKWNFQRQPADKSGLTAVHTYMYAYPRDIPVSVRHNSSMTIRAGVSNMFLLRDTQKPHELKLREISNREWGLSKILPRMDLVSFSSLLLFSLPSVSFPSVDPQVEKHRLVLNVLRESTMHDNTRYIFQR